jgi:hypothetical protein
MRHTVNGLFSDGIGCACYERIAPIRDDALELVVKDCSIECAISLVSFCAS